MLPIISIVIPTYNQVAFIRDTISSVLDQSYQNLEIIIADDCSTDGTVEVLNQFAEKDSRIKLLLSEKNIGIPANFNRAFDHVRGEYVAFLGGDDLMKPTKIAEQVQFLQQNKDHVLVQSDMEFIDENSNPTGKNHSDLGQIPTHPLDWVLKIDWNFDEKTTGVLPSSCLAKSTYYLAARYKETFHLKHELFFTLEDYCRQPEGKWGLIPQTLGSYRWHSNNFSQTTTSSRSILAENLLLCEMARKECPLLQERLEEFEFFVSYKAILFAEYSNSMERNRVKRIFRQHASRTQRLLLCLGVVLNRIGLLGIYLRAQRLFKFF